MSAPAAIVIVLNPCSLQGDVGALWQQAIADLRAHHLDGPVLETAGDARDMERIVACLRAAQPATVIAAGGDGTVSAVAQAIMHAALPAPPALGLLPLGTANNVARSLGLWSFRQRGVPAVVRAVGAIRGGVLRRLDLGAVAERYFIGSLAIGMDADILATRNRWRARLRVGRTLGGYPLYLCSCAFNLLRRHGGLAELRIDGTAERCAVYNLLLTNTPIYAGEFRFDAEAHVDDGRLDLHLFRGGLDYVRGFVAAWRRHLRFDAGDRVEPPAGMRRVRQIRVELTRPVVCQLDGEEVAPAASYAIRVVPGALAVRVPA